MADYYEFDVDKINSITKQHSKKVKVKLRSLNSSDETIGEINGFCTGGSLDITNSDLVRRSINLQFVANNSLEINEKSPFWINKRIQIFTGIEDYKKDTYWINQGIFIPTQPQTSVALTGRTISISAMDKMILADSQVLATTIVSFCKNYDLNNSKCKTCTRENCDSFSPRYTGEAIQELAKLYGETKFLINNIGEVLPYNYEMAAGDSIQDAIKEITNMYMNYECYYNVNGYLVFDKMRNRINDASVWDFVNENDFTISRNITADYTKVYNDFKIFGYYDDETGEQPSYQITIEDSNHPFSVRNMGRTHSLVISEDNYVTEEQCKVRAEYEKQCAENLINNFSLTVAPIYSLNNVNRVVIVSDNDNRYVCVIDSITYPLDVVSPMNINCHEIFI